MRRGFFLFFSPLSVVHRGWNPESRIGAGVHECAVLFRMTQDAASFDIAKEDAALNQYWYSPSTIDALVAEIQHHATSCAFLSAPSLYFGLADASLKGRSKVFEFDRQWGSDPGFVFYDYNKPLDVPIQLMGAFDYVVVDPPFITRDVWSKYLQTVAFLLKPKSSPSSNDGGKVLFTSVLENHAMLEQGLDQCLFVPLFKPSIPHLTYQYHCFLNYQATRLNSPNPEIPAEDAKIAAALQMANDLRESELAFSAQIHGRDRQGEVPLPAVQRALLREAQGAEDPNADVGQPIYGDRVLQWTHVPEGLTMYANGATGPEVAAEDVDFGPEYRALEYRRQQLEVFKKGVDKSQKLIDALSKNAIRQSKGGAGDASEKPSEDELATARQALAEHLASQEAILREFAEATADGATADTMVVSTMERCIAAYRDAAPEDRAKLQELAADATRKFKSPIFNRQKELLQEMKKLKAEVLASRN